jgi:hypothetical protein
MRLTERLNTCLRDGNLTVADLAVLFDRPYPTVRTWVHGGSVRAASHDLAEIEKRLVRIEKLIGIGKRLPVPRLPRDERVEYIRELATS